MAQHKRVCFVLPSAYGYFNTDMDVVGGGARQLSFISYELAGEFDVHFVVGDYGQPRREVYDGVTLHRSYRPSPDTSVYRKPAQLLKLFDAMRHADADIYVYRGRPFHAALTYGLARLLGRKWVYNLANDPNIDDQPAALSRPVRRFFEWALADADAVITQTDAQADRLRSKYGVPLTVVPSGYPPAESTRPHDDRDHFLWVGRLDPDQKRPHLYVDLAERVPDTDFLLIGPEGQNKTYNETLKNRMDEVPNLTYIGPVAPERIHEYYRNAIALVNTSAHEGFPSTFLEAWRCETPVVSFEVPVARYVDLDDYAGDVEGDFDQFVSVVSRLAAEPSFRSKLAAPTTEYFEQNLTLEQVADRYADVLQNVINT